jgi:hypothetical protein
MLIFRWKWPSLENVVEMFCSLCCWFVWHVVHYVCDEHLEGTIQWIKVRKS